MESFIHYAKIFQTKVVKILKKLNSSYLLSYGLILFKSLFRHTKLATKYKFSQRSDQFVKILGLLDLANFSKIFKDLSRQWKESSTKSHRFWVVLSFLEFFGNICYSLLGSNLLGKKVFKWIPIPGPLSFILLLTSAVIELRRLYQKYVTVKN